MMADLLDVQDTLFPNMATILDTDHVRQILESYHHLWDDDLAFVDLKKWDVRYRPGRECAAHYRMFFKRNGESRIRHQGITLELPAPTFDERRAEGKLDQVYRTLNNVMISEPFVEIKEVGAVLYPFPIDPYIPSLLEALDGDLMKQRFNALPRPKELRLRRVDARLISYTLGARATILYTVSYRHKQTGALSHDRVIGKLNARKTLTRELANNFALWRQTHERISLARPIGSFEELGLTLQSYVEGDPLGELLDQPEFSQYLIGTAEALAALHSARLPLAQKRDGARAARSIRRRKNVLKAAHPDLRKRVRKLTAELADRVEKTTIVMSPTHGDFHHTNILAREGRVSFIDFDEMTMGDPAGDVGRFIASLSIPSFRIFGDLRGPKIAREIFLKTYVGLTGIDVERVYLFEAASYLTSAVSAFRLQRENWRAHIELLLDRSEEILQQLTNVSLDVNSPPPLDYSERASWAKDDEYIALLAKPGIYRKYDAEVHKANMQTRKQHHTRTEYIYRLSGEKENEPWQKRVSGFLRPSGGAQRLSRDLKLFREHTRGQKRSFLAPAPIGSSSAIELLFYEAPQGTSLAHIKPDAWTVRHSQGLAHALAELHNSTLSLQRARDLDHTIKLYADGAKTEESYEKIRHLSQLLVGPSQIYRPTLAGFDARDVIFKDGRFFLSDPAVLVSATPVFAVAETERWLRRKISREARREFCRTYFSLRPEDRQDFDVAKKIVALSPRHRKRHHYKDRTSARVSIETSAFNDREPLYRSLLKACEGSIAVAGANCQSFISYVREKGKEATLLDPENDNSEAHAYDTIVLLGYLEQVDATEDAEAIAAIDRFLAPYGSILCSVPNEHFDSWNSGSRRFSEADVRKALAGYARVRPLIGQPLKWIMMTATKLRAPTKANAQRYDVMARLCQGRVLDLGCGPGHGTYEMAKRGCDVRGYDISKRKISLAQEFYPEIEFETADILHLPEALGQFDTVVLAEVIEHVDSETGETFLQNAWRHVGPSGRLVISVPNLNHVPHKNHLTVFSWQSLAALISQFGTPRIVTEQPYKWLLMYVDRTES